VSRLFDEMVEARRRGELALPDAEQETEGPPEETPEVHFSYSPAPGLWSCGRCSALVVDHLRAAHADWHRQIGG
jgi:hypothetical protein